MFGLRITIFLSLTTASLCMQAQSFFEGQVIYKSENFVLQKQVSPGKNLPHLLPDSLLPVSYITTYYKEGNWVQIPDAGPVESMSFDRHTNKIYWKWQGIDTLYYEDGRKKRLAEAAPGMKVRTLYNTDTILGKVCNSIVITTPSLSLTFVYSPSLPVNPAWYKQSKIGFYNLLYARSKAVMLKSIVKTRSSVSVTTATEIFDADVSNDVFPLTKGLPIKKL